MNTHNNTHPSLYHCHPTLSTSLHHPRSYDQSSLTPILSPWAFGTPPHPLTVTLSAAVVPPVAPSSLACALAQPPLVAGLLGLPAAGGWSVTGSVATNFFSASPAPSFNSSATSSGQGAGSVAQPVSGSSTSAVLLQGCTFTLSAPQLTPEWALYGRADTSSVAYFVGGADGGTVAALNSLGAANSAAALLRITLPPGFSLLSWTVSFSDGARLAEGAFTQISSPSAPLPLPPIQGGQCLLSSRAHALRVLLQPTQLVDTTSAGANAASPLLTSGYRGALMGYAVAGAAPPPPFPPSSAFTDTLLLSFETSNTLLRLVRSPKLGPLPVLALILALLGGSLCAGRLVHDVFDAACDCRALSDRRHVRGSCGLWGLLFPCLCRPPSTKLLSSRSGAGSDWAAAGANATTNALSHRFSGAAGVGEGQFEGGEGMQQQSAGAGVDSPARIAPLPPPPPPGRPTFARDPSLRFMGGLFGGAGPLQHEGEGGRAFDKRASPARVALQSAGRRIALMNTFAAASRRPGGGGEGEGAAVPAPVEAAAPPGPEEGAAAAAQHYKTAPQLGGWRGAEEGGATGSWLKSTWSPPRNGARPF